MVRSMDLIFTRIVGVIGEFACLRGLKLRIAFTILLEMDCRVRIMIGRQFNVALTKIGSLCLLIGCCLAMSTNRFGYTPRIFIENIEQPI